MKKVVIGILAHVDSGKTTLSEAMLFESGNINKLGRVDNKDSFLDTFSLERSRGITIFSKQALMKYNDTEITLIDTPGHIDFSAETERTLQVLDYAILVISGTDGIQSHTITLWKLLKKYNIPCFIFVNKMDLEGCDKEVILTNLKSKLSENCVDFSESDTNILENIALCSDKLLEKYENSKIGKDDIIDEIKERKVFPCLFGSALKLDGVSDFLNLISTYTKEPKYNDEFGARVYKISDDKGQKLTHIKITGGQLKVKDILKSDKNINNEKVNQIRIYSGDKFSTKDSVGAGTICALSGITFAKSGDGLGFESEEIKPILEPVLTYNLIINDDTDSHKALEIMKILENEEPELKVELDRKSDDIQVKLMGQIQLEILESILKDRFGISASFGKGNIIYKETIENTVEGVGHFEPLKHYAEVHLILKPLKRNSGLIFKTDCKEDILDKNWQRLILTHLYEKTHIGVLTGSPITDMEITLVSGKAHPKHTEGGDFRQATYRAVRQGLMEAKSILLEPIYDFILEVPNENVGRAMSDIQMLFGSFNSPESNNDYSIIKGKAPVSTMYDYAKTLRQYTHGKGKLNCTLSGYEPCHNENEIITKIAYNCDSDTTNTADSVFCSHGAGYNVKWDKVKSHMHLPSALSKPKAVESESIKNRSFSSIKNQNDLFALDKELMEIFEQTYGPIKNKSNPSSNHFTFTESNDRKSKRENKKIPAPKYVGPEYLLVDGYNVIFSWDSLNELSKDNIDGARQKLINILCNYQGYKKCEVILVFDAYKVKGNHREIEKINNINVVYTKEAETADMYIEKVSLDLAKKHKVRVVTSDALEQVIILGNGALRVSSREFEGEVRDAEKTIREIIESTH